MGLNVTSYNLEPFHWGTIFATLGLDMVVPYVPSMALQLPSGGKFLEGLRGLIRGFRKLEQQDREAELRFAASVFDWIQREFGPGSLQPPIQVGAGCFSGGREYQRECQCFPVGQYYPLWKA